MFSCREGNFPDIAAAGSLHEFLAKLHADHGPIASFWYGPKFTVSVASPDLLSDLKGVFDRPGKCALQKGYYHLLL